MIIIIGPGGIHHFICTLIKNAKENSFKLYNIAGYNKNARVPLSKIILQQLRNKLQEFPSWHDKVITFSDNTSQINTLRIRKINYDRL